MFKFKANDHVIYKGEHCKVVNFPTDPQGEKLLCVEFTSGQHKGGCVIIADESSLSIDTDGKEVEILEKVAEKYKFIASLHPTDRREFMNALDGMSIEEYVRMRETNE